MNIQKRGLRIKSKVCTLDNQIKRSGLRISHSKVFSSDLINSEHTGLVILTGGGIVQTRTAMVHRLCVWEVVEPRIIGSTSSFVHSRVKLKRSSLIWSSRFNYFFYLLNLASVRMSVLHVVNQKVKTYIYILNTILNTYWNQISKNLPSLVNLSYLQTPTLRSHPNLQNA